MLIVKNSISTEGYKSAKLFQLSLANIHINNLFVCRRGNALLAAVETELTLLVAVEVLGLELCDYIDDSNSVVVIAFTVAVKKVALKLNQISCLKIFAIQ